MRLCTKHISFRLGKNTKIKHRPQKGIWSRLRRFVGKLFRPKTSSFKGYRPYLGSNSQDGNSTENPELIHTKHKKRHRRHHSKGNYFLKQLGFGSLVKRWEKYKKKRYKQKLKNKQKRIHHRRKARERRIAFIRRYLPNYKKKEVVTVEFSHHYHHEDEEKQNLKGYLSYTANSTAYFILAYLILYLLYQITVLVTASHFKLDSVLFYYDLAFNDFSPLWNRNNIIIVTFSGPFIALIIGVLFFKVFTNRSKLKKSAKLFLLWIGIHGYNLFLGAFAAGVSFDEGFGYVPAWLFWNVFWQISVSLIFLFILGMISYYSAPKFLDTSYSQTRIRKKNKFKFLFFQVVLPWAIGALIIFLVKIPNNMPYESSTLLTLAFATVPVLFNRNAKPTKNYKTEKRSGKVKIWLLVMVVAALVLYRIGLNNGLHISLFYDFIFKIDIKPVPGNGIFQFNS